MKTKQYKDLQIEPEAQTFNMFYYYFQNIGLFLLLLFIFSALLGFFGNGILSHNKIKKNNFNIKYEKFIRTQSTTLFMISLHESSTCETLWINNNFFKNASIKSIAPTPTKEIITNDKIGYMFDCVPGRLHQIFLSLEPEKFGLREMIFHYGNDEIIINQYVYP